MSAQEMDIKSTFTNLFNKVAPEFDSFGTRTFTYFGERLVGNIGIVEGAKVLDIASGKGASLFPAAIRAGKSGFVTGIDIAEEMVKLTSDLVKERGMKNISVIHMDAENLTFPDESFDYILCGFGIFFMPDYKTALKEFMRALKKRGKLGLTTFLQKEYEDFNWLKELSQKYFNSKETKAAKLLDGPVFDTVEGMADILVKGGFKNINVFSEEKEFVLANAEEWWNRLWSQGSRLFIEKLEPDMVEQYKAEAFKHLNKMKKGDGIHIRQAVLFSFGEK